MDYISPKLDPAGLLLERGENQTKKPTPTYLNAEMIEDLKHAGSYKEVRARVLRMRKSNCGRRDSYRGTHTFLKYHKDYASNTDYYEGLVDMCNNVTQSPVTGVIRTAVKKAGVAMQENKRRVSRQFLTSLDIAQLQVIVNDLQRYIELLNDELVQLLMKRDELQMSQDATLIDIEDLSLYF